MRQDSTASRVIGAIRDGAVGGLKSAAWLASIIVPVSLVVVALEWFGVLAIVGDAIGPLFSHLGLPGASALSYLSGLAINLYSGIAVMESLDLTVRGMTILAVMSLIAHNFLIEIPVMRAAGSNPLRMMAIRLFVSISAGVVLSLILPTDSTWVEGRQEPGAAVVSSETSVDVAGGEVLRQWAVNTALLLARLVAIVVGLMIVERVIQALGLVRWLGARARPLMRLFGLPEEVAFLWIVSNTLGLAYGAGVLRRAVREGELSASDGDLLNHHMAISHSLLEDTAIYAALGVPFLWIVLPRLALAIAVVWLRRLEIRVRTKRRSAR